MLFVNGQNISELTDDMRGYWHDSYTGGAMLHKDDNTVLFKICNAIEWFGFGMRVTDHEGQPAKGIKVVLP